MAEYLWLRFDTPFQAWGAVAMDPARPTRDFPSRSALAGLLASALGWRYRDGARTTALQDALRYAVREDRTPRRHSDFQTADLTRETSGWTRWGVERRGGASIGTHILTKEYLAGGALSAALTVDGSAPVALDELADGLQHPARPLYLGRKSCPPAGPLLIGRSRAEHSYDALLDIPLSEPHDSGPFVCWYDQGDGPDKDEFLRTLEIWDRRDFLTDRFAGSRKIVRGSIPREAMEGDT